MTEQATIQRPNVTEELERLIDATSLLDVLTGLEMVCSEKADHIRENWQDKMLARRWDRASAICGKAARNDTIGSL